MDFKNVFFYKFLTLFLVKVFENLLWFKHINFTLLEWIYHVYSVPLKLILMAYWNLSSKKK